MRQVSLWVSGMLVVGCVTPLTMVDGGEGDAGAAAIDAGVDCNAGVMATAEVAFTERGPVLGEASSKGRAFRGIPFVKPPVGALRWRPPQEDRTCWAGVRPAKVFGSRCPQIDQQQGMAFDAGDPVQGDEDCLTLNVFTPAATQADAGLPVMVFIHGGGNVIGSAAEPLGSLPGFLYDGTTLAQRGQVVVVTLQYRVGLLGYLTMPALNAESDAGVSGNYGLQDQQAALRWVQRNVRHFGGDPSRVLLFGESAGAVNTCTHLAMPGSKGLFQRALLQSGSCSSALPVATRYSEASTWLPGTGCSTAPDVTACLRALSPEQLIRAYPVPVVVGGRRPTVSWGPTVDGVVLPKVPYEAMRLGEHHRVPLVVGSNADETSLTMPLISTEAEYRAAVTGLVGPLLVDRALQLYPTATYGTPRRALVQLTSDAFFGCSARLAARSAFIGQPSVPVSRYLFGRALSPARGAYHGVELTYVFQKLSELLPNPPAADVALEAAMLGYWTRFAASGDPNGVGAVPWSAYARGEPFLRFDSTLSSSMGWRTAECDFWDTVTGADVPAP